MKDKPPNGSNNKNDEVERDKRRTTVSVAASETVSRYGSANAEYIKGYTGIDNELGSKLHIGLKRISAQDTGLPQKAGTVAEIRVTNRNNAEHIIRKDGIKEMRTDDVSRQYGTNHPIADRLVINADGSRTYEQMKFERDTKELVFKLVKKDGEYAKYIDPGEVAEARARRHLANAEKLETKAYKSESAGRLDKASEHRRNAADLRVRAENNREIGSSEIKLSVPTEKVEELKRKLHDHANDCLKDAAENDTQAVLYEQQGNADAAERSRAEALTNRGEAERARKAAAQMVDSGLSQDQANRAAENPLWETTIEISRTSHRAGIESAKFSALIGSSISILTNTTEFAQGNKTLGEAATDVVLDTAKASASGYAAAAVGAATKGAMQQSGNKTLLTLSRTNAPALTANICLSLAMSVKRLVRGEIDEAEFLEEVGEKGAGMLSSSMMAAAGQIAIPVPFVGAAIGGMIGYTLSSMFYQHALDAASEAKKAAINLARVREFEIAARAEIQAQRTALNEFMAAEFAELARETKQLFEVVDSLDAQDTDAFAVAINCYAELLGKQLQFKSMAEFEDFMTSDEPLRL